MKVLLAAALLLSGCHKDVTATAPESFALMKPGHGDDASVVVRALSATGVLYRVRVEPIEKEQEKTDLATWKEAMAVKLKDDGYVLAETVDQAIDGHPGASVVAVAPVGKDDYAYMVTFAPVGKTIVIAESAGERQAFDKVRPQVVAALGQIKIKR